MHIGIKDTIDPYVLQYYESFYDILRTPDNNDKSRLLKLEHGIRTIGNPKDKRCRFCGKGENEVSFKKIAHVFPECIGNNVLASNYECDDCNQHFGNTIENEYGNFFSLYHSIMQIKGKRGVPKCSFKIPCPKRTDECSDHCLEMSFIDDKPVISACLEVDSQYVSLSDNSITISKPVGKCCPIAVFKAIVKMAITVMPAEELALFSSAIDWILEPKHINFYNDKKLLVRYQMIPGFNVTKYPHYMLFRRKKTIFGKPYMLFNLTYGCFSLFVEIPRDFDHSTNSEFEKMPFPPIPFYTSESGIWDLSGNETPQRMKHSITLNFSSMNDCAEDDELEKLLQDRGFQF